MKRYILFAGNTHYPRGGAEDYESEHDSIDHAIQSHNLNKYNHDGGWANIFDLKTKKIVKVLECYNWYDNKEQIPCFEEHKAVD